jgi:protein-disulfide isomerase
MMSALMSRWRRALAMLAVAAAALDPMMARAQARPEASAPIVIMVFSAFDCPYCAEGQKMIDGLQSKYPGKLRVVYKHFPLGADDAAYLAHEAALAAAQQHAYEPMAAALFADQAKGASRTRVEAIARRLKLDMARFGAALDSHEGRARIDADVAEASALKVVATPTYFIGGYKFEGLHQPSVFENIIDHQLGKSGATPQK